MSFTYGNFYGLTGIMALYADPAQINKMLHVPSISADARESLTALYQELNAIKSVFDPTNTDEAIPHASVSIDKNSEEAAKYLRGYNNYLAYVEQQAALYTSTDTPTDDLGMDDMDFGSDGFAGEPTDKTSLFVDVDDLDLEASDNNSDTDLGLDDMDFNAAEEQGPLAEEQEEVTLFSTYNQVYDSESGNIDLIKWGEIYPESYDTDEQRAKQLTWGAAIKRMKTESKDPLTAKFIAQRKKLPTIVANCSMSQQLKSIIRNAMGSDLSYVSTSFEEEFALKLLDSIHRKAMEPARVSLGGENTPKLDLLLKLLKDAINAPSNAYIKRFGVSMSELALWNTRTPYVINSMVIKFADNLLNMDALRKSKPEDAIKTIQHLLADCNYLLGEDNSDIKTGSSEEDIEDLFNSCEDSPVMTPQICEAFLRDKFMLSNTEIVDVSGMLTKFITYGMNCGDDDSIRLHALKTLLASQENLMFAYHAYVTANSSIQQLSSELLRIYSSCLADDSDPLNVRTLDFTDDEVYTKLQDAMLSLFKGFVLRTGLCGCSLCFFDKMYAMTSQMRPAIISTAPVKFTAPGYERAHNAIFLFRGYLRSVLRRINRMCKEA